MSLTKIILNHIKKYSDIPESFYLRTPGPSCSKLTTSLVNVSLKFQTLILQIHCYLLQRILTFFQQK